MTKSSLRFTNFRHRREPGLLRFLLSTPITTWSPAVVLGPLSPPDVPANGSAAVASTKCELRKRKVYSPDNLIRSSWQPGVAKEKGTLVLMPLVGAVCGMFLSLMGRRPVARFWRGLDNYWFRGCSQSAPQC